MLQLFYSFLMSIQFPATITVEALNQVSIKDQLPETFGLRFTEVGKDYLKAQLTVDHRHLRPGKIMNGGVSLVLIETVGSMSAASLTDFKTKNPLGLQVSANHLSIAYPGDTLTATSYPVHVGRTTHVWDVKIQNQDGKAICDGRITMLIADKKGE